MNFSSAAMLAVFTVGIAALAACSTESDPAMPQNETAENAEAVAGNPFFNESPLPLRYPRFDRIEDAHFAPAFDRGMAEQLEKISAIATNPDDATFENTIVAMEKSGRVLDRARTIFSNLVSADTNETRQKLRADYAARFSAHLDAIRLNPDLFARIEKLYEQRDTLDLDPQATYLVERYYTDFVRSGAALPEVEKERLKAINSELAELGTRFSENVLNEVNESAVLVESRTRLDGLTDAQIATAADAAADRGLDGKYVISLLNTTGQPPLAQLTDRDLRERIFRASIARNSRGNEYDNTGIVARVLELRAERAELLGYETYADYVLEDTTARSADAVNEMLGQLAPAAVANAKKEGIAIQAVVDREQAAKGEESFELAPWDWAYYAEKVRQDTYDFDEAQLKPYLEMKNVLENGVFFAANRLYGLRFEERTDLPKYHPDTWTYDVFEADGRQLAIFIFDPYARPSKRGGAWMNSYVDQSGLFNAQPVVANHLNISKPAEGEPTLMTWTEVTTMFHEFGHALHGMFSDVEYPYFYMKVPRDFVEFPSQVNEMWADWPEVIANYAKHHETGEPMPQALLDKVIASQTFNQGFATTEYLAAAMLDQSLHQADESEIPTADSVMAFEAAALAKNGTDYEPVPPRYRTPYFSHIMGGYASGYYAYIWSEILDANTVEWIKENGGITKENGDRLRERLLAPGGSREASRLFLDFTGREPDIAPLLIRRGLVSDVEDDSLPPINR